ncbi:MAG: tetratricopeptide repeat protein [Phormidesmis sp.]
MFKVTESNPYASMMTPYEEIVTLTQQAQQAIADRRYSSALAAYGQALKLTHKLKRPQLMAVLLDYRGKTLERQGDIQQAVIAYESALQALSNESSDDVEQMIARLSRVGKGFQASPEPIPDLYSAQAAENLAAAENDSALEIKLWLSVGNAYFRQSQEMPALNAYREVLACKQIDAQPFLKAYAKSNIGEIYRRQDKLELAEAELTDALILFESQSGPESQSGTESQLDILEQRRALALLGGIARDLNQHLRAIKFYNKAIVLYRQAKDIQGLARTLAGFGRLYLEQDNFSAAAPLYQEALQCAKSNHDEETLWHAYWGVGCCQYGQGDLVAAIASFEASLTLIEKRQGQLQTDEGKVTFLGSVKDVFDQLLIAHLALAQTQENPDFSAALAIVEKSRGRALADLMGGRNRRRRASRYADQDVGDRTREDGVVMPNERLLDTGIVGKEPVVIEQRAAGIPMERIPFDDVFEDALGNIEQRATGISVEPNPLGLEMDLSTARSSFIDAGVEEQLNINTPSLARLVFYVLPDKTAIFAVDPSGNVKGHIADIGCQEWRCCNNIKGTV